MSRFAQIVVLAEDKPQQNLLRAALKKLGIHNGELIVEAPVLGQNCGWVREHLPPEVEVLREKSYLRAVIAVVDADEYTVAERKGWLDGTLKPARGPQENIVYVIPRRHIETWVWYLEGNAVDENGDYKKKNGGTVRDDHDLASAKRVFADYIQTGHEPFPNCPDSLRDARAELRRVFP